MMLAIFYKRYLITTISSILCLYLSCIWCSKQEKSDKALYAVIILSKKNSTERRDAIRSTWKKFGANIFLVEDKLYYKWTLRRQMKYKLSKFVKLYFVIGLKDPGTEEQLRQLKTENNENSDMLFMNELDDSVTEKILCAINWVYENLKNIKYLIKCNDYSFVRYDLIIQDLEFDLKLNTSIISEFETSSKNKLEVRTGGIGLYWGYFIGNASVETKENWRDPAWFLCDNYLPYALGGGYVISRTIITYIARNYEMLSRYNSEDVSMGVWTAALTGVTRIHDVRFDTDQTSRGCSNNMLIRHRLSPLDMLAMYNILLDSHGEKQCPNANEDGP